MRILYKTLASVGMLALSTAAAIGIRRLVKRKNEKEKAAHDEVKETNDDALKEQTTDNANSGDETVDNGEKIDRGKRSHRRRNSHSPNDRRYKSR